MSSRVVPRLGPGQVGQRVVVRRRLPTGQLTDLLGELLAWDEAAALARVRTRHGDVEVRLADIVAGKPVPPPPTRTGVPHQTITWQALQDVAADGWRAPEQAWLGGPGRGWRLRCADGFTSRANSVLAVGDPGRPLPAAIEAAEQWYRQRGQPARFAVPGPLGDAVAAVLDPPDGTLLDPLLAARGYLADRRTIVHTASTRQVAARCSLPGSAALPDGIAITLDDQPDESWLDRYRYRGQPAPPVARRLLLSAPAQVFGSVRARTGTLAVARGASARGWTGLSAISVAPEHRGLGLANALVGAVAEWALERGDRSLYLQVADDDPAALRRYGRAGFTAHHRYHYRTQPPAADHR